MDGKPNKRQVAAILAWVGGPSTLRESLDEHVFNVAVHATVDLNLGSRTALPKPSQVCSVTLKQLRGFKHVFAPVRVVGEDLEEMEIGAEKEVEKETEKEPEKGSRRGRKGETGKK